MAQKKRENNHTSNGRGGGGKREVTKPKRENATAKEGAKKQFEKSLDVGRGRDNVSQKGG